MVRKVIGILTGVLLLLCGAAATASAVSVYEGTISSTFTEIAKDINISVLDDYVFFRSGQYTYTLATGDFDYNNGVFTLSENGKVYTVTQVTNSGYGASSYYSYSVSDVTSYKVETKGILVYSNLGEYPGLHEYTEVYDFMLMFLVLVIALCALVRPLFNFVLRYRGVVKND